MSKSKGFSLVELLIVVTIIVILVAIGIVMYTGLNQRVRDAIRLADFANIQQALMIVTHETNSLADMLCFDSETPCQSSSFPVDNLTRITNGSGWVKVDFDKANLVNFKQLPIDPSNDINHQYFYYSDGKNWKIETTLESFQYQTLMQTDGGTNPQKYEISSKFSP